MQFNIFFIIIPGLEELAAKEMNLKCPLTNINVIKGGIEATATLEEIDKVHRLLKIPTRILLRLDSFRVKDFPKLFSKLSKFSWNKYLSHPEPLFEISCTKSRLFHTEKITTTFQDAIKEYLKGQPLSEDWKKFNYSAQTFYVRIYDDELTLSLDLSGESLHKRGIQTIKGEAPLRETIASALILELMDSLNHEISLVDPMCGSGTFLVEAKHFFIPNYERKFAFEESPLFKGKHFKKIKTSTSFPISEYFGFDINEELILKINNQKEISYSALNSLESPLNVNKNSFFICNPPYGERLQIDHKKGVFLKKALKKYLEMDKPSRLGWLIPKDMDSAIDIPKNYFIKSKRSFRNGGLPVTFWIFERNI